MAGNDAEDEPPDRENYYAFFQEEGEALVIDSSFSLDEILRPWLNPSVIIVPPHKVSREGTLWCPNGESRPAEILGVSREVGSLDAGKLADIVVLSAPIFASDAQVLRVLSAGTTQYEAR